MAQRRLVSIGECMVEMASVGNGLFRQGFAGDTFNMAWHARRALPAGWEVSYVTAVGDDSISRQMVDFMAGQGIDTRHVQHLPGRTPGLYLIELDKGERSFTYWRSAAAARALADDRDVLADAVASADAIFFSGITLAILTPDARATLLDVLAAAKARGALVGFDSNIRPRLWPDKDALRSAILRAAEVSTIALPTGDDERLVFGDAGDNDVARRYLAASVAEVVVKAGAGPALVTWPGGEAQVPPPQVASVVDTTGAGDSFNGAYLAARLTGFDPVAAAQKAHANAARVIQAYGALV